MNQPNRDREPWVVSNKAEPREAKVEGNCEMMEAKISIEMPLPIPCSVMSSPSHMRMMELAVMAETDTIQSIMEGLTATDALATTDL